MPLPITVISGYPGAGKSTVLHHLLQQPGDRRIAVIQAPPDRPTSALPEDFLQQALLLVEEGQHDYLVLEAHGYVDPMSVAEALLVADETGDQLRLDTLVTVVDGSAFLLDYNSADALPTEAGESEQTVAELMAEQVEVANVLVISKCDLLPEGQADRLEALLRHFNTTARIVRAEQGVVPPEWLLGTEAFTPGGLEQAPGWDIILQGEDILEQEGVSSFAYRARRPFHPERFVDTLREMLSTVLRARGFVWLATRPDQSALFSVAGKVVIVEPAGEWLALTPQEQWPDDEETQQYVEHAWEDEFGDRRQEFALTGVHMDQDEITAALDGALLTDDEMALGEEGWAEFPDPLPSWQE